LIVRFFTGVFVFDFTVKDFVKGPFADDALKVTLMLPLSPGFTGVLEKSATEQPHEGDTLARIIGASPTFVK
jgi:hypothetical protein